MRLRKFLYLDTKVIEDYLAAIEGYTYDEEAQSISKSSENCVGGKGSVGIASGQGTHTGMMAKEIKRSVKISDAAKFDKVYDFLREDEMDGMKYYEFIPEEEYNNLRRDDFIEVLVTARFSKMKALTDSVMKIAELSNILESITNQEILDKEAKAAVNGFAALGQLNSDKAIACVFEFGDGNFPLIADLNQNFFRCEQSNFVGQAYLLCKVIRKIPKGEKVKLDEIFDDIKKMPLNRDQRRRMLKEMENPTEVRDVIKGPALIVSPIAVYQ